MMIREDQRVEYQQYVEMNQDAYGKAVVEFEQRRADLMEQKMAEGATLQSITHHTNP